MPATISHRERFLNCLLGKPVDRPPFLFCWGPWGSAWERWKKEGMSEQFPDVKEFWQLPGKFGADVGPQCLPLRLGPCPSVPWRKLAEDAETITYVDGYGIKRRGLKGKDSMDDFVEFPVKTRDDWETYKRWRLHPDHPDRLNTDWLERGREWMAKEYPIQIGNFPEGVFGAVRWLLGDEQALMVFYDDPELVHDIMDHFTTVYLTVYAQVVAAGIRIDVIHIWEDMCGKQGPLISPAHWREFMGPCYRRIKAFAQEHRIPILSVDTDGQPEAIIPVMMEHGVNYLWPFEVAAGCDVNDVGRRYPTLAMMGGVDKRPLAKDAAAIDAEMARLAPAVKAGRYIPQIDHLVPSDISWPNYVRYVQGIKRLVGA